MPDRLPLFPLSLVLFPGLVLPLHIFEERYRILMSELRERPEPERVFGVIAIRQGREVGADGVDALYDVGCTAVLRRSEQDEDGGFDIVTTGGTRFALRGLQHDRPYLVGEVDLLPDPPSDGGEVRWEEAVRMAYLDYLTALRGAGAQVDEHPDLPGDALTLSYLVAASMQLDLPERQSLLVAPSALTRLQDELAMLRLESRLLRAFGALPAPELARTPAHWN